MVNLTFSKFFFIKTILKVVEVRVGSGFGSDLAKSWIRIRSAETVKNWMKMSTGNGVREHQFCSAATYGYIISSKCTGTSYRYCTGTTGILYAYLTRRRFFKCLNFYHK